jgi:arylsulfatase A-like enzyme
MNKVFVSSLSVYGLSILMPSYSAQIKENKKPNIIVVFTDDQGYQDLGCFGSPKIKTPNIDRMATEGIRFTDFYVSASVCSPSRASLLTGRMPVNNGLGNVIFPETDGMSSDETTIAEMLKPAGYKTACFGKWHVGDTEGHLPTDQGFDTYFGIPYSNDMFISPSQKFSSSVQLLNSYTLEKAKADQAFVKENLRNTASIKAQGLKELCPLLEGKEIAEYPCDQSTLTQRYFDRSIAFIEDAGKQPFFIYITPAMPHIPLHASTAFKGTSARGLYGDVVEEIDMNVGKLLAFLKKQHLDKNTLVIFSSDNGPWIEHGEEAGCALPFRDGKFSNYEGGVRTPCIMWWPGKIPAETVSNQVATTMDFLPTIAHYTGAKLPKVKLDGINLSKHLENPATPIPRDTYYYSKGKVIWGIRKGDWKYLPHGGARFADKNSSPELYNLKEDISESTNLYSQYPEKAKELAGIMKSYNETIAKNEN